MLHILLGSFYMKYQLWKLFIMLSLYEKLRNNFLDVNIGRNKCIFKPLTISQIYSQTAISCYFLIWEIYLQDSYLYGMNKLLWIHSDIMLPKLWNLGFFVFVVSIKSLFLLLAKWSRLFSLNMCRYCWQGKQWWVLFKNHILQNWCANNQGRWLGKRQNLSQFVSSWFILHFIYFW